MMFKIYYSYRDRRGMSVTDSEYADANTLELRVRQLRSGGCKVIKVTALVETKPKASVRGIVYSNI